MRTTRFTLATLLALAMAAPLHAQVHALGKYAALGDQFYNDPDDDDAPRAGLHFADLEYAMPRDPLLWSSDPGWEAHHTPSRLMADANRQLRDAIPLGTSAETAAAMLHKAGARCAAASQSELACRYNDVETPYGGEYMDYITWNVKLALDNGRVSALAVTRDWSRQ